MALLGLESGDPISPHGWNQAATKVASECYGGWARERLDRDKEPQTVSTRSLVKKKRGREHLGYALTKGGTLTEHDKRAMLQARSACYPTEVHVARMQGRDVTEGRCKLCRR
jgi:hypothetical protein